MSGLFKPGSSQLADTANSLAGKVGGGMDGTYDLPSMITRGFTMPQYNGPVGVGINQSQQDILGMGSMLMQKYFGGGYAAQPPSGMQNYTSPMVPVSGFSGYDPRTGFRQNVGGINGTLVDPTTGQPAGEGTSGRGPVYRVPFPPGSGVNPRSGGIPGGSLLDMFSGQSAQDMGNGLYGGVSYTGPGSSPGYLDPSQIPLWNSLSGNIQQNGFTSLTPQQQAQFNWMRATGNSGDPGQTGRNYLPGAQTGVYPWDPRTMTGDLPPFASIIAGLQNGSAYSAQPDQYGSLGRGIMSTGGMSANGVPVYTPDFNPANIPGTGSNHPPTSYNFNPQFGGQNPYSNTPGLGFNSLEPGLPGNPGGSQVPGTNDVLSGFLRSIGSNPGNFNSQIMSLISGGTGGQQGNLAQGGAGIQQLMQSLGLSNPSGIDTSMLRRLAGQDVVGSSVGPLTDAQNMISGFQDNPALKSLMGGAGTGSFDQIFQALDKGRQAGLARDERDLREQFSANGLRFGSDLSGAIGQRQSESENNMFAQLAQIIPSLTGQDVQGKSAGLNFLSSLPTALTQIGQTAGNLSLGQQGNTIQALTGSGNLSNTGKSESGNILSSILASMGQAAGGQAGNSTQGAGILSSLFSNNQNSSMQALLNSPQALQSLNMLPYLLGQAQQTQAGGDLGLLGNLFNMNQTSTTQNDTNAVRAYQEFQRTQQLFPQLLSFLSGTPMPQQASPFSQGMNAVTSIGSLAAGAGALKSAK